MKIATIKKLLGESMIEVEMKIKISESDFLKVEQKLNSKSNKKVEEIMDDLYFQHPCRNFGETDEALRIRISNNDVFITYKGPKLSEEMKTREEIEFKVEDFDKAKRALERLGFVPVAHVKKHRVSYEYGDYTISLDRVNQLGTFLEIECDISSEREIEEKENHIKTFLRERLGIKEFKSIRKSYLEMLLEKNNT